MNPNFFCEKHNTRFTSARPCEKCYKEAVILEKTNIDFHKSFMYGFFNGLISHARIPVQYNLAPISDDSAYRAGWQKAKNMVERLFGTNSKRATKVKSKKGKVKPL